MSVYSGETICITGIGTNGARVGTVVHEAVYLSQDIWRASEYSETGPGQVYERRPIRIFKRKRTTPFDRVPLVVLSVEYCKFALVQDP